MIFGNIHYKHVKKVEYNVHATKDSAPKSADGKTEKLKIAFVAWSMLSTGIVKLPRRSFERG